MLLVAIRRLMCRLRLGRMRVYSEHIYMSIYMCVCACACIGLCIKTSC